MSQLLSGNAWKSPPPSLPNSWMMLKPQVLSAMLQGSFANELMPCLHQLRLVSRGAGCSSGLAVHVGVNCVLRHTVCCHVRDWGSK